MKVNSVQRRARATLDKWFSSYKRPHILFAWPFSVGPDIFSCIIVWLTVSRVLQKEIAITWNMIVCTCLVFENHRQFQRSSKKKYKKLFRLMFARYLYQLSRLPKCFFFYWAFYRFEMLPDLTVRIEKETWNLEKREENAWRETDHRKFSLHNIIGFSDFLSSFQKTRCPNSEPWIRAKPLKQ